MTDPFGDAHRKFLPSTAPDALPVSVRGFADTTYAESLGPLVGEAVHFIGRFMDLSRLDGITVAVDYSDALAHLDRGTETTKPLVPTETEHMVGVAMATSVIRNGVVKAHLVFHAAIVTALEQPDTEIYRAAFYTVAHECAHVEDLKLRDESFPGRELQERINDGEEAILEPIYSAIWNEYVACRRSAVFGEGQLVHYQTTFCSMLGVAIGDAKTAIRSYRVHGDLSRVLNEAGQSLSFPLRAAAYLVGHLDGLELGLEDAPEASAALRGHPYEPLIDRATAALRQLWSARGKSRASTDFDVLRNVVRDAFAACGMFFERRPDGDVFVRIPFTADTLP